jgi:hypothetical protein
MLGELDILLQDLVAALERIAKRLDELVPLLERLAQR